MPTIQELEAERATLLQTIETETSRLLEANPGQLPAFLNEGTLPISLQTDVPFAAARDTLEQQFQNADESLISNIGARGGALQSLRAGNQRSRAISLGSLELQEGLRESDIRQQLFGQTLSTAFGAPQTALSGLQGSGSQFGQLAQIASSEQLAQGQALGSAAGLAAKFALKGGGGGSSGINSGLLQSGASELLLN